MTLDELAVLFDLAADRKLKRTDDAALESLARDGMVTTLGRVSSVSERGSAFVQFVLALPLPVGGWAMQGHEAYLGGEALAGRIRWVSPEFREGQLHIAGIEDDDGPAPPAPPLKVKRVIDDPEQRKAEALRLMERGFGLGEIKDELSLTSADMQDYFQADV